LCAPLDAFVRTVRSVASGTDVLPPALTGTLFSHIVSVAVARKPSEVLKAVRMTERERAVFDLIADGLSNKEIAQRLQLATNTVKGTRTQHFREAGAAYAVTGRGLRSEEQQVGAPVGLIRSAQ
jgi:two-component system, NarL family, response regulator DevR